MEENRAIPAKASSGEVAAVELSYQWVSMEDPPLIDLYISRLGHRFWGESWHFLPDEAGRLAGLLEEAAGAVLRKERGLVGEFVRAGAPSTERTLPWLTVSVSPAPYLGTEAPRVRLVFDDEMTAEVPDAASLWFTAAASRRLARELRLTSVRASYDERARQETHETMVRVDHACPDLVPGHLLRVTGVGFRTHSINVHWVLIPPLSEDELTHLLQGMASNALDDLGNEYHFSGSGYSPGAATLNVEARGLFSLKPGPHARATRLTFSLHGSSRSSARATRETFEVNIDPVINLEAPPRPPGGGN